MAIKHFKKRITTMITSKLILNYPKIVVIIIIIIIIMIIIIYFLQMSS